MRGVFTTFPNHKNLKVNFSPFIFQEMTLVNILVKNPYFFTTPKFWNPYFFPVFCCCCCCFLFVCFFFRKFVNQFHLSFCWVLSIEWGRWFFVKKLEKGELNIKHVWCRMGWRVFNLGVTLWQGGKTLVSKNTSISESAVDEIDNVLL